MSSQPEDRTVRYVRSGDAQIAYQVVGKGPVDLVIVPAGLSNLEIMWEEPGWARLVTRFASFARVIVFDMRGLGLSRGGSEPPVAERLMDDIRAVMDAAGSEQAVLFGGARAAASALLLAASDPERVRSLVLYAPIIRTMIAPDWPYGFTAEQYESWMAGMVSEIGSAHGLEYLAPSRAGDGRFEAWWGRMGRLAASPATWRKVLQIIDQIDVRAVVPAVHVPTLVLHRTGDRLADLEQSRWVVDRIRGARLVELPGEDHLPFVGDIDHVADEVEEFLTGVRPVPEPDRMLATVLFTDIVGATDTAARLGDRHWRSLLERHHAVVRGELERCRGREVDTAGDGFFATFDGPARGIRCAAAVVAAVRSLGIEIRAGLHTGEVELSGGQLRGIAVHIGARLMALAGPSEVLVSSTVKDLVFGSGIEFTDQGMHLLKGVPGEWRLFAVVTGD